MIAMRMPWQKQPASTAATSRSWLVADGQIRAIQTDDDIMAMLGVAVGADGLPTSFRARALAYSASAACLRLISTLCAAAPLHAYSVGADGDRSRLRDHAAERLLNGFANPWQASPDFIREMTLEALFEGDAYARVVRVRGESRELHILRNVSPETDDFTGEPRYKITGKNGQQEVLKYSDVIHLRSPSGGAPTKQANGDIELGLLLERSARNLFKNGGRPAGILTFTVKVDAATAKEARKSWNEDSDLNGGIAVLGGGVKFEPLTMTSTDAEHLSNRQHQVLATARHYGLSPTLLAELADASLNNAEALGRQTIQFAVGPWLQQWAGAVTRCLVKPEDRAGTYLEHETGGITAADAKATAEALRLLVGGPLLSANEGRGRLNAGKIEGGEKLYPVQGASPNATGNPAPAA